MEKMTHKEVAQTKGKTDWDKLRAAPDYDGPSEIRVDWSSAKMVPNKSER